MEVLFYLVPRHCQGVEIITNTVTGILKPSEKDNNSRNVFGRPSSKSNQLQPTVLLAASPPSVLSLQVSQFYLPSYRKKYFQLEGAYGRACSVKEAVEGKSEEEERAGANNEEGNLNNNEETNLNINLGLNPVSLSGSREDTVSPMASQRTGNLSPNNLLVLIRPMSTWGPIYGPRP